MIILDRFTEPEPEQSPWAQYCMWLEGSYNRGFLSNLLVKFIKCCLQAELPRLWKENGLALSKSRQSQKSNVHMCRDVSLEKIEQFHQMAPFKNFVRTNQQLDLPRATLSSPINTALRFQRQLYKSFARDSNVGHFLGFDPYLILHNKQHHMKAQLSSFHFIGYCLENHRRLKSQNHLV